MSAELLVVGDALLDRDVDGHSERLCPDAPVPVVDQDSVRLRPGGAGLAALLAAAGGARVRLLTALADDAAGAALARALLAAGVELIELRLEGTTPEKVRIACVGEPLLRLDRGRPGAVLGDGAGRALRSALASADAVLVSDYGNGVAAETGVREALAARPAGLPLVWDPHPRGPAPIEGTDVATPNEAEAAGCAAAGRAGSGRLGTESAAAALRREWNVGAVCVTDGARGAVLAADDGTVERFPCAPAAGDPCGAGDRFAAALALALAAGAGRADAVRAAVAAASSFVAGGGARALRPPALRQSLGPHSGTNDCRSADPYSVEAAAALADAARRRGGTVVATGGCFDLLHLGHARTLEAARRLGDCLVVLVNSDRSVRELKGPERPLVSELERAAMLRSLGCVDEVAIFDEADPRAALARLRPAVWAKGGDYGAERLPERELIASWGGRVAILPYLEGRSTTGLIEEAGARAS